MSQFGLHYPYKIDDQNPDSIFLVCAAGNARKLENEQNTISFRDPANNRLIEFFSILDTGNL